MKISIVTVSNSELISSEKNDSIKLICSQMYKNGFDVVLNEIIQNKSDIISSTLSQALNISDALVFISDNDFEKSYVCKKVICHEFDTQLVNNEFAKKNIEEYSREKNVPLRKEDYSYFQLPEIARCIKNPEGVFQGFLIEKNGKVLFFLPLNYKELHHTFFASVLPYILQSAKGKLNSAYVFKTYGIKGSEMTLLLKDLIKNKHGIEVVCNEYLLSGEIIVNVPANLREDVVNNFTSSLYTKILPYVYSDSDRTASEMLLELLSITHRKIVFAEDFTAGKMASTLFEELPNAEDVLCECYICPSSESKSRILGVDNALFKNYYSVDQEEVAYQMALGALENSGADIVVSNCGDLKNGLVTFAIGTSEGIHIFNQKVEGSNEQKITSASNAIFFRLIKKIKQNDFHLKQNIV